MYNNKEINKYNKQENEIKNEKLIKMKVRMKNGIYK